MSCSHYEERVEKVELPQLKVNGVAIGEDLLARELQYHPADSYALALEAACRALIVRQLLLQRADALGIEAEVARFASDSADVACEAIASGANGGDILFLEACVARGIPERRRKALSGCRSA